MSVIMRKAQKDIGDHESKLIGPFTSRQVALLGAGIVPTVAAIFILRGLGADMSVMVMFAMFFMAGPCFLAFGKKMCYGMKPEDFVADYIFYHFKCPRERFYKTETLDDTLEKKKKKEENPEEKQSKSKKKAETPKPAKKRKEISGFRSFE